jgi:hypothetical protein
MFTSQAIGPATSDRIVVVGLSFSGTNSPSMDIPVNGVTIAGFTATQGAYSRPAGGGAEAIYYALVTSGTTATIGVTGYGSGFINEIIINTATITGSAAGSITSTYLAPTYSNGLTTSPSITVPTNGVVVICDVSNNNGGASTSTWSNATRDNDQYDGNTFGLTGTMAHLTASATVSLTSVAGGGPAGWIAAAFQP